MIFYLNRGLILEQEIVKALKNYLATAGVKEYYKNFTINVTNEHPFARLLTDTTASKKSLFPAIVVATEEDEKPEQLTNLVEADGVTLEPEDIDLLAGRYFMMTPKKVDAIREALEVNGGKLYGVTKTIRRQDHISIEIWSENIQLKNELYELVRLFVAGWMIDYFQKLYEEYALTIFDNTVRGQRSNNYNVDFGIELAGAHIAFDADYAIEQTVIDTELVDANNIILEVINHAKNESGTTRSRIIGDDDEFGEPA
jgi:hypothetical protein